MKRRFFTLDVFSRNRFAGNPLAVVLDSGGLDDAWMQAIAREFNLSETVFVFAPEDRAHRAHLRIFTPTVEVPFAGHPTVGTAVLLAQLDGGKAVDFVLEEKIGAVSCRFEPRGECGYARFALPRLPEQAGPVADDVKLAAALGLTPDQIGEGGFQPENWSAGNPFTFVPVKGLAAVRAAGPQSGPWDAAFGGGRFAAAFVFTREVEETGSAFHARMFAPGVGVPEDPATGSAVAAFAGYVARHEGLPDGAHLLRVEQGYEMGRPSQIELHLTMAGGGLTGASIGGEAVVVSEGTIET